MTVRGPVDLLLRCLAARGDVLSADDFGQHTADDWREAARIAAWYRVASLLFKRLKLGGARDLVPADVWDVLLVTYFNNARRSVRLQRGLRPVLVGLRRAGIPVIALKGAFLAEAVYGDVAVRPMGDVDLMVPRDEVPRVQAMLIEMGGAPEQSREGADWWFRTECHLPAVVLPDLTVEVHWSIERPVGTVDIDAAGLWQRAHPATVAGVEVQALCSEDLLLHLCLHATCRECLKAGLRPLSDISETIHRFGDEIDWMQLAERARDWGATRYAGLTLHLARSLLGARVPDEVLGRLVPGGINRHLLETARESTLALANYQSSVSPLDRWSAMPLGEKAREVWGRVFCTREELAARYPASRYSRHFYFYHALRFRDVIRNIAVHMLRRGPDTSRTRGQSRSASLANWLEERVTINDEQQAVNGVR